MARVENDTGLLPSILDRLLDDAPNLQYEAIPNRFQDLRQVKEAVKRDIEALLNTRQETLDELPQSFTEVRRSLLVYGLPDCTALSLHNPQDHRRIRQALEYTIATFERRLERVRVTVEPPQPYDHALRFRIDALLRVEPAPEPITFDAMLQLNTRQYVVQGYA
jgi:type VI secretion system protein ImpF